MGAVDAAEAVRGVAAREEASQLLLDVARQAPAAVLVLEPGEERLQVLADERVQGHRRRVAAQDLDGPFGSAPIVRSTPHRPSDGRASTR